MKICKICGKKFITDSSLLKHVACTYGKEVKKKHVPMGAYRWKYMGDKNFSPASIRKMYWKQGMSALEISEQLEITKTTLLLLMEFYSIKRRSRGEAKSNSIAKKGLWNRGLTKFDHPSIMKISKERMGKNNPMYAEPGSKARLEKLREFGFKGCKRFNANRNPKSTERRFAKILDKNKISYLRNFALKFKSMQNGKPKNMWRLYDFLIGDNVLIELQGDYWHMNPAVYNGNEVDVKDRKAKDIWDYDEEKKKLAMDRGYLFAEMWERDLKSMTDSEVLNFVLNTIKCKKSKNKRKQ